MGAVAGVAGSSTAAVAGVAAAAAARDGAVGDRGAARGHVGDAKGELVSADDLGVVGADDDLVRLRREAGGGVAHLLELRVEPPGERGPCAPSRCSGRSVARRAVRRLDGAVLVRGVVAAYFWP